MIWPAPTTNGWGLVWRSRWSRAWLDAELWRLVLLTDELLVFEAVDGTAFVYFLADLPGLSLVTLDDDGFRVEPVS